MKELLDLLALRESGGSYTIVYGGKHLPLTTMTIGQVLAAQAKMKVSSACGRYQIIQATLRMLVRQLGLSNDALFDEAMQDRLAERLVRNRGLDRFLASTLSAEDFANNLAKEWASLPVVTPIKGPHRQLKPGQSYYAGDGLNKAFHKPEDVLRVLNRMKGTTMTDELRKKANDAFQAKLRELQGRPPVDKPEARETQGLIVDLGKTFCDNAQQGIDLMQKEIHQFRMFIPDKYEHLILPVLAGFEAILPEFCGKAPE